MATKNEVTVDIVGKDKASDAIKGVSGGIQNMAKVATVAGAAITAAMTAMVVSAMKFEGKMREVNTMMGLSEEQFIDFGKEVTEVSREVGKSSSDLAGAMYQIISAGVGSADAINVLEVAAKAAVGGVTDTMTAADGLTTVLNAFKIPAKDVQRVADVMFTTVKGGKTTFQELSQSMFNVAPIAAAAGIQFEEVAAAIATVTKQGVPTSVATTQLRAAIQAIIKPTAEMTEALKAAGYESGEAMLAELGFAKSITKLRDEAGGSLGVLGKMFQSIEGTSAILSLTGDNATTFASDLVNAMNSAGAATAAYDEVNKGAGRQVEILWNEIKLTGQEIGTSLLPMLKELLTEVSKVTGAIADWVAQHPELTKFIATMTALTGGFLMFSGAAIIASNALKTTFIPMMVKTVAFIWTKMIPALTAKIALLLASMAAMGPAGWVMLGVATAAIAGLAIAVPALVKSLTTPKVSPPGGGGALYPPSMDSGGFVPGPIGSPVPVLARGGEFFGGWPPRGGGDTIIIQAGAFMGRPEDARKFADMISEAQRKNNRRTFGRSA